MGEQFKKYKYEWVADISAILGIIALLPVSWYITETMNVDSLSGSWLVIRLIAASGWLFFGMKNKIRPTVMSAVSIIVIVLFLLAMKIYGSLNKNCL